MLISHLIVDITPATHDDDDQTRTKMNEEEFRVDKEEGRISSFKGEKRKKDLEQLNNIWKKSANG